jgi:hypothetical protein
LSYVAALLVAVPGAAQAADIVINNGLAPPDPANVIDHTTYFKDSVHVRNAGCPPKWPDGKPDDECPSPGAATQVAVVDGANVDYMRVYDSSIVTLSGGDNADVGELFSYGSSTVTMTGGEIDRGVHSLGSSIVTVSGGSLGDVRTDENCNFTLSGVDVDGEMATYGDSTVTMTGGSVDALHAYESSRVTMIGWADVWENLTAHDSAGVTIIGGSVAGDIRAADASRIIILGFDFAVDGASVPYGDLEPETGRLTGTTIFGQPVDNEFFQGGRSYTGRITLGYPAPSLLINNGLAPPNLENVIDDGTYSTYIVDVRNAGCPPEWPAGYIDDPCPDPGAPTEVALVDGGSVGYFFTVNDSSIITMSGGTAQNVVSAVGDDSTVTLSGGVVGNDLVAQGSNSTVDMSGGIVGNHLIAYGSHSTVTMSDGEVTGISGTHGSHATLTMNGGYVGDYLTAAGSDSSVTMTGGQVENFFQAYGTDSTTTLSGGRVETYYAHGSHASATMSGGEVEKNLYAYGSNSIVTLSGGLVGEYLLATGSESAVTMSGGTVEIGATAYGNDSKLSMRGGTVVGHLTAYGSNSKVTMHDGIVGGHLTAYGSESTVAMCGGNVGYVTGIDSSSSTMNGGTVQNYVNACDSSSITIRGEGFAVDGEPAPYGDLTAQTGVLTGTLSSGDPISNVFYQGGSVECTCPDEPPCTGTITLAPPAAELDIRPGSDTNPINPKSEGVVRVAILGSECFDVADVDVTTLAFGPSGAAPVDSEGGHQQDVNGDGFTDLVSHYRTQDTGIAFGDTEACVTGETFDGTPWGLCDFVNTMPPGQCGIGLELAFVVPPLMWLRQRRKRRVQ